MAHQKRNQGNFGNPEHNGKPHAACELTLPEEAEVLIQLALEELADILVDYPHHATYCFASITRLAHTNENISYLARRFGMWLWMKVLAFEIEEPLCFSELAAHFDTELREAETVIDELVSAGEFNMEWNEEGQLKLAPCMLKETVIYFAEQVLSGIEDAEQAEGEDTEHGSWLL